MPAPDRPDSDQPARGGIDASTGGKPRDLSAVPSFLRQPTRPNAAPAVDRGEAPSRRSLAIPRPATPPPSEADTEAPKPLDPASLPMPSLSRRRVVTAAGVLIAGLLALSFARQVGEATAASNRAADLRAANAALHEEVDRLQRDLDRVQDLRYILLEGRAVGLGGPGEVPFALAGGAPPLGDDAPGSASVRLGAEAVHRTPLDAWLEVLFGPGR